jgi:hypothetical protein
VLNPRSAAAEIRFYLQVRCAECETQQEVMEAIWVAAEMRAGAAYAHSNLALDTMNQVAAKQGHNA